MSEELVFTVTGDTAQIGRPITLAEAGLTERQHLQEWVLGNPDILGSSVMIITSEFDRWESRAGAERDRLDVLALGADGHLVVAELKRDTAPDSVQMQAIKYAAMASRFDADVLADAYVDFQQRHYQKTVSTEEAAEILSTHTDFAMSDETLRAPRIVLIASQFPANVTATAVWLSEMGLDISLIRVQAYELPTPARIVITVSQHYPPPDVKEFLVAPTRASRRAQAAPELPEEQWTIGDLTRLATQVRNVTIHMTLDLCSERPGEWIPSDAIQSATGREPAKNRGDYGGFGGTLRRRFSRSNPPFETKWAAGGTSQQYYKVTQEIAEMWRTAITSRPEDMTPTRPTDASVDGVAEPP
jgi:hypothetical protein